MFSVQGLGVNGFREFRVLLRCCVVMVHLCYS